MLIFLCILSSKVEINPWRPQLTSQHPRPLKCPAQYSSTLTTQWGDEGRVRSFSSTDLTHLFAMSHRKNFHVVF